MELYDYVILITMCAFHCENGALIRIQTKLWAYHIKFQDMWKIAINYVSP